MLPHLQGSLSKASRLGSQKAVHTFPVNYNTTGISSGVLVGKILASTDKPVVVRVGYNINTAFNAATTNVLTAGTSTTATEWIDQNDVDETSTGNVSPRLGGFALYENLAAATTSGAITQFSLNATGAASGVVSPVHPRNVVLTITDANASITAISITVLGVNCAGNTVSETFAFSDFTALVATGNIAFQTVTSVTINSVTGGAAADKLDMGYGVKIGLPGGPGSTTVRQIKTTSGTTTVTETPSASSATYGTVTMGTAPDGALDFSVFYNTRLSTMPTMKQFRLTADTSIYVKYTQTGTAATTGAATLVVEEYEENITAID